MTTLFINVIGIISFWLGWQKAHSDIADEIDKLGGFFAGKRVFKCVGIKDKNDG